MGSWGQYRVTGSVWVSVGVNGVMEVIGVSGDVEEIGGNGDVGVSGDVGVNGVSGVSRDRQRHMTESHDSVT